MSVDCLQKFTFKTKPVRGQIVRAKRAVAEALQFHQYPDALAMPLREALTLVPLLAGTLKLPAKVRMQIQDNQQKNVILAQSDHEFGVRGYVRAVDPNTQDFFADLNPGFLILALEPEQSEERYEGVVELASSGIVDSVKHYFSHSEQINTWLQYATDGTQSAALMLQAMPDQDDSAQALSDLQVLAATLGEQEFLATDNATLLKRLFAEEDIVLHETRPVSFRCQCSASRMQKMLLTLGREAVFDTVGDKKVIDVCCEFCGQTYTLDRVECEELFVRGHVSQPGDMSH